MKTTRRIVQLAFLTLTIVGVFVVRGNAERWCPFGGVEAIYTYIQEGDMICSLGISNFYILAAVLVLTLLVRRAFCGYACPIGAISEWLQSGAKRIGIKPARVPRRLDRVLAKLKYVVLAVILYFTWRAGELEFRVADPCYALISRHGEDITFWAYVVAGAIVLASLFVVMPFCRWFCPLAAVFHPFSRFGLTRIKRDEDACIACNLCAEVCPTAIPVDEVREVTAARCMSCLNCVDVCPEVDAGAISWGPPKSIGRSWPQAALIAILLFCITAAVTAAYIFPIASYVKVFDNRPAAPAQTATVDLDINGLACRGSAALFVYFVDRDDELAVPGYVKLEAWPGPDPALARIAYDPAKADEAMIKDAIVEPYFDGEIWRTSPFTVEGYDPLDVDAEGESATP